jgi:hypothetical protein
MRCFSLLSTSHNYIKVSVSESFRSLSRWLHPHNSRYHNPLRASWGFTTRQPHGFCCRRHSGNGPRDESCSYPTCFVLPEVLGRLQPNMYTHNRTHLQVNKTVLDFETYHNAEHTNRTVAPRSSTEEINSACIISTQLNTNSVTFCLHKYIHI